MVGFEFGFILGAIVGVVGTLKIAKWLILGQMRREEHQKVDSTYESRKEKYL